MMQLDAWLSAAWRDVNSFLKLKTRKTIFENNSARINFTQSIKWIQIKQHISNRIIFFFKLERENKNWDLKFQFRPFLFSPYLLSKFKSSFGFSLRENKRANFVVYKHRRQSSFFLSFFLLFYFFLFFLSFSHLFSSWETTLVYISIRKRKRKRKREKNLSKNKNKQIKTFFFLIFFLFN